MKVNLNVNVNGCKCRICGGNINGEGVAVQGLKGYASNEKNAYFHLSCFYPKRYHASDRRENISGVRDNFSELRLGNISSEFEVVSENDDFEYDIVNDEAYANVYITLLGLITVFSNSQRKIAPSLVKHPVVVVIYMVLQNGCMNVPKMN